MENAHSRRSEPKVSARHRAPWVFALGLALAGAGTGLAASAATAPDRPLLLQGSAVVVIAAALLEFAAGLSLSRRGGAGMSHTVGGALALGLAAFLLAVWRVFPDSFAPGPAALMLGLVCVCNGAFRLLDVAITRPAASRFEAFDAGFTLVLGAFLLHSWHAATPALIGVFAGLEVLVGGVSMAGSAGAWWRHPERPAYDDLQERLTTQP